jgi:uracil-DNA glycosylase
MAPYGPKLILFGSHAKAVRKIPGAEALEAVALEHPFNHSFIHNPEAHELFGPMRLLEMGDRAF